MGEGGCMREKRSKLIAYKVERNASQPVKNVSKIEIGVKTLDWVVESVRNFEQLEH